MQQKKNVVRNKGDCRESAGQCKAEWHELSERIAETLAQLAQESNVYFALERIENVRTQIDSGTRHFI